MRVLCIQNSSILPFDTKAIPVIKGSIYNVTDVVTLCPLFKAGDWYILLETGDATKHHNSLFREIDDVSEEVEEQVLEEILTN